MLNGCRPGNKNLLPQIDIFSNRYLTFYKRVVKYILYSTFQCEI